MPNKSQAQVIVFSTPLEQDLSTASGMFLPETAKEKPQEGLSIAIGDDEMIRVKPQDKVLFGKYAGTGVWLDGPDHLILEASDILSRVAD